MRVPNIITGLVVGLALLASKPAFAQQQNRMETVVRNVSDFQLESILARNMGIQFSKRQGEGGTIYQFERNNFKIQLLNARGRTLLLQAVFPEVPVATINAWNVQAMLSRAVLYNPSGRSFSALEMGLDCQGGVTANTVRQFINTFADEVPRFANFLRQANEGPGVLPPGPMPR